MAENANQATRYFSPDKLKAYFALHLDDFYCRKMTEKGLPLIESVIGSRQTLEYAPEISLLTRSCFYSTSLLCYGCTPGQAFCALKPMHFVEPGQSTRHSSSAVSIRNLSSSQICGLIVAYTLLPYLYDRRDTIWSAVSNLIAVVQSEEDVHPFEDWMQLQQPQTGENDNPNTSSRDETAGIQTSAAPAVERSSFQLLRDALLQCWQEIAADQSTRLSTVLSFLFDLHQFLFLLTGQALEVPMTLTNLQLVSTTAPSRQIKLDALAWLVGFQTSLQCYYIARVLQHAIDRSLEAPQQPENESAVEPSPGTDSQRRCALCLDGIVAPAGIPCGHVFCWNCVVPYALHRQGRAEDKGKCPVCRAAFSFHNIRFLSHYS